MRQQFCVLVSVLLTVLYSFNFAKAFDDPTKGEPFLPWAWNKQLKPTIQEAGELNNLSVLAMGGVATAGAFQYEQEVYEHNRRGQDLIMSADTAGSLGTLGGGGLGVGIAVLQLFIDQQNGLQHSRAIVLTSTSHLLLAFMFSKGRPDARPDYLPFKSAFPSGHSSNAFATATSLANSYGYFVGVPAFALATAISAARVSENAHWISDVVAGAALGIYWGEASADAAAKAETLTWMPVPIPGGLALTLQTQF